MQAIPTVSQPDPVTDSPGHHAAIERRQELLTDESIVSRIIAGETDLFEVIVRRYSQRLYRVARRILRNDADAEDAVQQAYLSAFRHLQQFERRAKFSTWLTQITVNQSLAQRRRRHENLFNQADNQTIDGIRSDASDPERLAYAAESDALLRSVVAVVPARFRSVFMLRDVHGLSIEDTAGRLSLTTGAVKTRLHRARAWLRRRLETVAPDNATRFDGSRCDRLTTAVMSQLTAGCATPVARWHKSGLAAGQLRPTDAGPQRQPRGRR